MFSLIDLKNKKNWYLNYQIHREKGPAIEYENGNNYWYFEGKLHRKENLPASIIDGKNNYFLNGEQYHLQENGTREFFDFYGRRHRVNGPAIEYSNGDEEWWLLGKRHRDDEPAVIYGDKKFWFEFGEFIKCID